MLRPPMHRCLASSTRPSLGRPYSANSLLLSSSDASSSSMPQQPHPPTPPRMNGEDEYVSDREWELRTGHAIDTLQQTLPNFFNAGLVSTNYHLPLHIHGLLGGGLAKGQGRADEHNSEANGEEGIYGRTIRLEYTPPVALPAPFPRVLGVEGLPLYVASSVFVRHAMHALYSDLAVAMHKVQIRSGPPSQVSHPSNSPSSPAAPEDALDSQKHRRERAITIGLLVSGAGRLGLSTERAEWDVTSTYTFSPHSGRIVLHTVNEIHPEPSETVYAALQTALSTLGSGFGPSGSRKGAMNVARGQTPH